MLIKMLSQMYIFCCFLNVKYRIFRNQYLPVSCSSQVNYHVAKFPTHRTIKDSYLFLVNDLDHAGLGQINAQHRRSRQFRSEMKRNMSSISLKKLQKQPKNEFVVRLITTF